MYKLGGYNPTSNHQTPIGRATFITLYSCLYYHFLKSMSDFSAHMCVIFNTRPHTSQSPGATVLDVTQRDMCLAGRSGTRMPECVEGKEALLEPN